MAEKFGQYEKDGDVREPGDQAEVNDLVWRGFKPVTKGAAAKSGTDKS